jgi:thiamine-monophosphate kinase
MAEQRFADIGRVEAVSTLLRDGGFDPLSPSVFPAEAGDRIVSASRVFIEGMDFNLVYFPFRHLGYKCITAVVGELYAAMAVPRSASVTLGLSTKLDFSEVRELWSGMSGALREHGVGKVSLDLVPSPNGLTAGVSMVGSRGKLTSSRLPVPKSKDLLCVSGSLGAAYLGMRILEKGRADYEKTGKQPDLEKYKMLVGAYLKPEMGDGIVSRLEAEELYPSAGVLVTRGLADAVKRLSRRTGLGAKVYADKIPFEGNSFAAGRELDVDPVSAAMNGGEDYRLLFAIPILSLEKFRREFQTFDIIGHLALPEAGAVLVTPDGAELPLRAQGWNDNPE